MKTSSNFMLTLGIIFGIVVLMMYVSVNGGRLHTSDAVPQDEPLLYSWPPLDPPLRDTTVWQGDSVELRSTFGMYHPPAPLSLAEYRYRFLWNHIDRLDSTLNAHMREALK